jgi:hypothetical protein
MDLAHHQAAVRSKSGAASGLASILRSGAGGVDLREEMRPLLKQMVPKIYRSLYDPNPKVQVRAWG